MNDELVKVRIYTDELYPVYTIEVSNGDYHNAIIPKELCEKYQRIYKEFMDIQGVIERAKKDIL